MNASLRCWVCETPPGPPILSLAPPAATSTGALLAVQTEVYACDRCGHLFSPSLPDASTFYGSQYRISLQSEMHDQIYGMVDGQPLFRSQQQAKAVLEMLDLPRGGRILDYGGAKAATLRRITAERPDLTPMVFDVSNDYRQAWEGWIAPQDAATFQTPVDWAGKIDAVTAHYVLEHVQDLAGTLAQVRAVLKPGGRFFFSAPGWARNTGDLMVVDHVNHFTERSIEALLARTGFGLERLASDVLPGAFVAVAVLGAATVPADPVPPPIQATEAAAFWITAAANLAKAAERLRGRRAAIYGAGFYGSWIAARVMGDVNLKAFMDANVHLHGGSLLDRPILAPDQAPETDVIFVGLNPAHARRIAAETPLLSGAHGEVLFLDAA